jgi:tetratricopeptide (TPR) repeat protein
MVSASIPPWLHWLVPLLVALVTLTAFWPALQNGFVNWDDDMNFLLNVHYRGLGLSELRWMFTTSIATGQWIPLTWLTLGLDYVLWGMRPIGYHLTSVLLHAANASVFFFITRRLLGAAGPELGARARALGAGAAALVFALHPLRVESVAWVTERRDVLSGLFFLLTLLGYLRAADGGGTGRRRWLAASVGFYALALAAKAVVVTLPLLLVVLDVYPLRRLPARWRGWLAPAVRRVWAEKVPYGPLALVAAGVAAYALRVSTLAPDAYPLWAHVFIGAHSLCFYVWKTLLPLRLSPLYELPARIDPLDPVLLGSVVAVVGIGAGVWALRRRWPAGLAACAAYVLLLAPVSGLPRTIGPQLVATRYSYLSCLPWAVLAGAGLVSGWQLLRRSTPGMLTLALAGLPVCIVIGLGVLTWNQVQVWHDSARLWSYTVAIGYGSPIAHNNWGAALNDQGNWPEAIAHFQQALRLNPDYAEAYNNWGLALAYQGKPAEAIVHFQQALRLQPDYADAHNNWGAALNNQGNWPEAIAHFQQALRLKPDDADAHTNWGWALAEQGEPTEAIEHFKEALRFKPDGAEAHTNWGVALLRQGELAEMMEQVLSIVPVRPSSSKRSQTADGQGKVAESRPQPVDVQAKVAEAIGHFQQALRIRPDYALAHANLGAALLRQGNLAEAIEHFREALRIDPGLAAAHNGLGQALAQQRRRAEPK